MPGTVLFSLAISAIGGMLVAWHVKSWRGVKRTVTDETELRFYFRQYRRRVMASSVIALLGPGVLYGGGLADPNDRAVYWAAILLILVWLVLVAMFDALASWSRLAGLRRARKSENDRQVKALKSLVAEHQRESSDEGRPSTRSKPR